MIFFHSCKLALHLSDITTEIQILSGLKITFSWRGDTHYIILYNTIVLSLSHVWLFETHELQHARHFWPSLSPWVWSNSSSLSQSVHVTISSSITHFSSCPQSFPSSVSFPTSWLFAPSGQSIGASASAPDLPMNIKGWFPLGLTGLIFLLSKGLLRVFSSATVLKHQFFSPQLPL